MLIWSSQTDSREYVPGFRLYAGTLKREPDSVVSIFPVLAPDMLQPLVARLSLLPYSQIKLEDHCICAMLIPRRMNFLMESNPRIGRITVHRHVSD